MITLALMRCLQLPWVVVGLFVREEGQDMVEYGLLAGLISIVAVAMIILVGPYLDNMFKDIANSLACMEQPHPC